MPSIDTATEPLETLAAARRLGVSPHTLFKWRMQGRGPVFSRRGRKIVYSVADLEAYERATRQVDARQDVTVGEFAAARVRAP
jgi:transposase-like protein